MGKFIIKLHDHYLEWSTIVDAPVTWGQDLANFRKWYQLNYGLEGMRTLDERLARVAETGTSSRIHNSVDEVIAGNHLGPDFEELTADEIHRAYCLRQPLDNGWCPE